MESPFLLVLAAFFGLMCLVILAISVFAALLVMRVGSFSNMLTADFVPPPAEDFLASAVLRSWEPGAFADLSTRWQGDWKSLTRLGRFESYTHGVVRSLRDLEGPGWIAFAVHSDHRKERQGLILLKTGARRVELKVSGDRLNPNVQLQAMVDGTEWGSIAVTYPTCLYHSADRATEARWAPVLRPKLAYVVTALIVSDPDYYPLTVNDRPVAALADMWIRSPRPGVTKPFPPALQSVGADLKPDEEAILLMMLGMSLYFDTLHRRRLRHDW